MTLQTSTTFADLGVSPDLVATLRARSIDTPFPIQALTIADGLAGRDLSGRAPTGSGKTLAFGIPLSARLGRARPRLPRGLVLVPTRELAAQVSGELTWLGRTSKLRVSAVYGGAGYAHQIKALRRGVDVLVACPGRLADLIERGEVDLGEVEIVVLDEADRMADMGFLPAVRALLDQTPPSRQTLLFSATLDGAVDGIVRDYQRDPVRHELPVEPVDTSLVQHHFWRVARDARVAVTTDVITESGPTIVFCRTKHGADGVAKKLARNGVRVDTIHGNRTQGQRERALAAFATGRIDALIATDVAARGIHVDDVACVVHFDPPADEKDYTHRSGRTARAGASGTVVSLVQPDQERTVKRMQRTLDLPVGITRPTTLDRVGSAEPILRAVVTHEAAVPVEEAAATKAVELHGHIKFYDTKRGFGFIARPGDADLFVHHSALDVPGHRLREGQAVAFAIRPGRRGEEARDVRLVAA
jgi:superfamily II DNA/RNA helicase/cold shock CspA family protein